MNLKIGDKIVIKNSGNYYAYTKDGAKGIIINISAEGCGIRFDPRTLSPEYRTEGLQNYRHTDFWIEKKFIFLDNTETKENRSIEKIQYLDNKFKTYQQRKKHASI